MNQYKRYVYKYKLAVIFAVVIGSIFLLQQSGVYADQADGVTDGVQGQIGDASDKVESRNQEVIDRVDMDEVITEYESIEHELAEEQRISEVGDVVKDVEFEFNSSPIAKFTVDKDSYGLGEEIIYSNLSYDPDGDAVYLSWSGRQEAFFVAGEYEVTLVAIDDYGNESDPYTKTIHITNNSNEKSISELDFYIRSSEPGEYIDGIEAHVLEHALSISEVKKKSRPVEQRKLLVSDSPENITESGILYEDTINGKARLYANHVNAGAQPIKLAILATNETDESITLFTSRQGQSMPSKLALLVGSEAALDFMSEAEVRSGVDSTDDSKLLHIAPGETIIYRQLPTLAPQFGLNAIHDVQSSGELRMTFVAVPETEKLGVESLSLARLPFQGHLRGSFPVSTIKWDVYPRKPLGKRRPIQRLTLGDGDRDLFLVGYDQLQSQEAVLRGNYGATYEITIHKPGKMAVLLLARGGGFKGAFKVDDQYVRTPASGMLPPFKGFVTVAKTEGTERSITIEWIPPAGSSLPILLVLFPIE